MKNPTSYHHDYTIYPGEYAPLRKEDEIKEEFKYSNNADIIHPPVNLTELANSFEVEVAIPGVKREDFLLYADKNILSVFVVNHECEINQSKNFHVHEFDHKWFKRTVTLPENVDVNFACAEYKAGILHVCVPKTKQPAYDLHSRIVVY